MDEKLKEFYENKKVIFVGPSPEIKNNGNNFGEFIDGFDIVIRANGGYDIVNLYYNYIGLKTDVLFINIPFITRNSKFNIDNYLNSNINYIYYYGGLNIKSYKLIKIDMMNTKNNISKYIGYKCEQPFGGMYIVNEVLKYKPKELYIVGVSNYNDNIHIDNYLPDKYPKDDVISNQKKFHKNTINDQYIYFSKLLKENKIKMDLYSSKYFK